MTVTLRLPVTTPIKELAGDGPPANEFAIVEEGMNDELVTLSDETTNEELERVGEKTDIELATSEVESTLDKLPRMDDGEKRAAPSVSVGVGDTERDWTDDDALSHLPNPA
jgi:hypothetical protein